MVPNGTGEHIHEIEEADAGGAGTPGNKMRLMDYIPIYIPTVEKRVMNKSRHEKRFLDFLRAHPSKEWFLKSRFIGRLRRRSSNQDVDTSSDPDSGNRPRRFRVPFVRKINWRSLWASFKNWIKNPANIAMFIWLVFVVVGLVMLGLLMVGLLNGAIPSSARRKKWTEVINQILNALFTIMCLYQHPRIFHHAVLLLRWRPADRAEIRKVYCKDESPKPHERAHMAFVVSLLHLTCFAQYFCCGLFWGYSRKARPDWALNLGYGIGTASPVIAGLYASYSPLGRKRAESETSDEDSPQSQEMTDVDANNPSATTDIKIYNRRVVVSSPEWSGGLFDCWDDATVFCLSTLCVFCVFGWNMERLGFGNMYVHIFTFILLCLAPFLIFNISALNVGDDVVRYVMAGIGIALCLCGFLYGGFWRIQMRKRFKLPGNTVCCGRPAVADCAQWLFCWCCSLAQEVRTGNFYDVEDDQFFTRVRDEQGRSVLLPLPREGNSGLLLSGLESPARSLSCPPKISPKMANGSSPFQFTISMERSATYNGNGVHHAMNPPLPNLMQMEDHA